MGPAATHSQNRWISRKHLAVRQKICYNRTYVLQTYRTKTTASAATSATRILNNNLANRMSNKMLAALPPEAASYLW